MTVLQRVDRERKVLKFNFLDTFLFFFFTFYKTFKAFVLIEFNYTAF